MTEEKVLFKSGDLKLQGLYSDNPGNNGVIVTHPHPQMGGSMDNNIVNALVSVFSDRHYSTLRFNFRGVGNSEGFYDHGRGEMEDVIAAMGFLIEKNKRNITLAGYSFGAVVAVSALNRLDHIGNIVLISPPLDKDNLIKNNPSKKRGLIICGDGDQFCQVDNIRKWAEKLKFDFKIIEGADHFYWGMENKIIKQLNDYLQTV